MVFTYTDQQPSPTVCPPLPPLRLQEMVFTYTDQQFESGAVILERVHMLHSYATPIPVRIHVEKKGTPLEVILMINITASAEIVNRPMLVLNPQVTSSGALWVMSRKPPATKNNKGFTNPKP